MRQLSVLYTANKQCYSVRYSPFDSSLLACVSCDNLSPEGGASLYIMKYQESALFASKFSILESYKMNTHLFDVDWSPTDQELLVTANGDGSISIWRWPSASSAAPSAKAGPISQDRKPVYTQSQHKKEVKSVQWEPSQLRAYNIVSASHDNTVKIWNLNNTGLTCLFSLNAHESQVHSSSWNYKTSGILLTSSADKTFRIWDVNSGNGTPVYTSKAGQSDVLSCDWNRFDSNLFALGYVSGLIELRDFRNLKSEPLKTLEAAHEYAVRKIRFSPHVPDMFGSVSFDTSTKLWNTSTGMLDWSKNHGEFTYGFDFDSKLPNRLADCGWDRRVMISEFELESASSSL